MLPPFQPFYPPFFSQTHQQQHNNTIQRPMMKQPCKRTKQAFLIIKRKSRLTSSKSLSRISSSCSL